jgi:hemerythrin-like metal-binding protein
MALISWTPNLSVGIDSIDEQHLVLIDMLNDFYEHLQKRSNTESIGKLIDGMKEYTFMHFDMEEALMEKFGYPDFATHKKEHELFVEKVVGLEQKFRKGQLVLSFEITNFLKNWLKDHILILDK